jgi:hypothetical protein
MIAISGKYLRSSSSTFPKPDPTRLSGPPQVAQRLLAAISTPQRKQLCPSIFPT